MENKIIAALGMSWLDYMKKFKPDIDEKEADYILWNETCYPFNTEIAISQIEIYFNTLKNPIS